MAITILPSPAIEWHTGLPTFDSFLNWAWSSKRHRLHAMLGVATVSGLTTGIIIPRGPVTTGQALLLIIFALLAGELSGLALGSRWAMLLLPPAHLVVFEVARIRATGPTVDGIDLDKGFGWSDFWMGRGFYAFLILLPMLLGVSWGASYVRRHAVSPRRTRRLGRVLRRGISWISTVLIVLTVVGLVIPAGVPAVVDEQGHRIPGSIAELERVPIGGVNQWIEIRGASEDLPVVLYLPPVPGLGNMPASRQLLDPLAQSFVVVTWDMRGSGKSYPAFDPETLTVDQLVADTIELTDYLRDRFDEEKIYLVAEWWGTLFSVLAAQQHPELYYAVINSDQMVAPAESDRLMYLNLMMWARNWDSFPSDELIEEFRGYGPPPYSDFRTYQEITLDYSGYVTSQSILGGQDSPPGCYWYPGRTWFGWEPVGLEGPEYTLLDRINALRSRSDVFATLYPHLQEIDLRRTVTSLDVPIFVLDREQLFSASFFFGHPLPGTLDLMLEWFEALDAPAKHWHKQLPLKPRGLRNLMVDTVLPATYPNS